MKHSFLAVTVCASLFAITARATLITYEGFDYTATTDLEGLNGGTGWGAAWDNQSFAEPPPAYTVKSPGMSYSSLIVSGNRGGHAQSFDNTGRRLDTSFGGAWNSAGFVSDPFVEPDINQGVVWGSVLLQRDNATATFDSGPTFALHRNNLTWFINSDKSLEFNWNATSSLWQAAVNGGPPVTLSTSALGSPTLFVFKLELDPSGTNNIYVWQDPTGLGGPDLLNSSANASFTGLASSAARFRAVGFYGGGSANNATSMDEIRFGTTFASVTPIPEPSAIALLSLGLLTTIYLRRRR